MSGYRGQIEKIGNGICMALTTRDTSGLNTRRRWGPCVDRDGESKNRYLCVSSDCDVIRYSDTCLYEDQVSITIKY